MDFEGEKIIIDLMSAGIISLRLLNMVEAMEIAGLI